ncbi:MAG: hypothetical protein D6743_08440 [Calditrichaeota bacterium]|nr:MAG: hypothetical protein D6743_08440 [Calditrichota bacterium]
MDDDGDLDLLLGDNSGGLYFFRNLADVTPQRHGGAHLGGRGLTPPVSLACLPNPVKPHSEIRYLVERKAEIVLSVHNLRGELVRTLVDARQKPGLRSVSWDGTDNDGKTVPDGMYLLRFGSPTNFVARHLVFLSR